MELVLSQKSEAEKSSFLSVFLLTAFFLYVMGWGLYGVWLALFLDQSIRAGCATVLVQRLKRKIRQHMEKLGELR